MSDKTECKRKGVDQKKKVVQNKYHALVKWSSIYLKQYESHAKLSSSIQSTEPSTKSTVIEQRPDDIT